MARKSARRFFTTLPGILTGIAAVIAAITGLYVVLQDGSDTEPRPERPTRRTVQVSAQGGWQDAGISLTRGQTVRVTADGTVTYSTVESAPNGGECGPTGVGQLPWTKDKSVVKKWNHAALIARLVPVGDNQKKHLIGRGAVIEAKRDGSLQFRLNDTATANNSGSFLVIASWQ